MRNLYSFILVFLFSAFLPVSVSSQDVCGTISGNVTWGPGSVNVVGDVSVTGNLTIAAGTTVSASDQVMITVTSNGTITAQGIEGNEILFTAANPSSGWEGIYFDGGTGDESASVFEYCVFEYGKKTGTGTFNSSGGVIYLDNHSNVAFSNCMFQNNEVQRYGGAFKAVESQVSISNCVFKNNSTTSFDGGGAIDIVNGEGNILKIENSSFYNNYSHTGGALMAEGCSGLNIVGCIFANNEANFGGAVTVSQTSSNLSFVNNTFSFNKTINSDATIRVAAIQGFNFINNIISGFDADNAIEFDGAYADNLTFENCLIEGGLSSVLGLPASYVWTDMVDGTASFVAPSSASGLAGDGSTADWQLGDQSPAINGGKEDISGLNLETLDLAGNTRVRQGRIDIGALESNFV
ncbi:MAG TPA: right-handed parallel beta-helix repeat-containing protein, partial [Bacteroidales bacterium]|nr:right-handed parallel beta-helix repeat-containing protein [Bacteroidales bacterium]